MFGFCLLPTLYLKFIRWSSLQLINIFTFLKYLVYKKCWLFRALMNYYILIHTFRFIQYNSCLNALKLQALLLILLTDDVGRIPPGCMRMLLFTECFSVVMKQHLSQELFTLSRVYSMLWRPPKTLHVMALTLL